MTALVGGFYSLLRDLVCWQIVWACSLLWWRRTPLGINILFLWPLQTTIVLALLGYRSVWSFLVVGGAWSILSLFFRRFILSAYGFGSATFGSYIRTYFIFLVHGPYWALCPITITNGLAYTHVSSASLRHHS